MMNHTRYLDSLETIVGDCTRIHRVLIIGPGTTDPVAELLCILPVATFVLMEIDPRVTEKLQMRWAANNRITCICADASTSMRQTRSGYDLALIRHPDVARFTNRWTRVLGYVTQTVSPNGVIVVSTFSLDEEMAIRSILHVQNVNLIPGAPYTSVPLDLSGNDRYIMAYKGNGQAP
jgi:predicted membrane-bound spermidine synthase